MVVAVGWGEFLGFFLFRSVVLFWPCGGLRRGGTLSPDKNLLKLVLMASLVVAENQYMGWQWSHLLDLVHLFSPCWSGTVDSL